MAHEDKLQAVAATCVKQNAVGCDCACGGCQYNVFNYTDTRTAGILMANARANFITLKEYEQKVEQDISNHNLAALAFMALIIGLVAWGCNACSAPSQSFYGMNDSGPARLTPMQQTAEVKYLLAHQNEPKNIPRILAVMRSQGVQDVNRDGKVNCIDNSITFHRLYGSNAHIMINKNPLNGFNHMFIIVWQGMNAWHIEPQGDPDWYAMGVVWGMKYKPYYNSDVTSVWGGYVGVL